MFTVLNKKIERHEKEIKRQKMQYYLALFLRECSFYLYLMQKKYFLSLGDFV